ncbi:MAG: sulfatase-like hydrolase/transferase [Bacteroidetes bacterium]|nr:sulfatase-like hydrolase/transferase [Bacteroidota bacterium]
MNSLVTRSRLIGILAISMMVSSCYPLATGSLKWRIIWKPSIKEEKAALLSGLSKREHESKPPNIVLIVADDLGKFEVSSYGANHISTPNIDKIGDEGVWFQDAYVSSPVCAPSRAGLLTGRNQVRFGFETQMYEYYPSNMLEYLTGRFLADTEDWVVKSKPVFPREWQIVKQGLPPSEINLAELLKTRGYTTGITGKWHLGHHRRLRPNERGFDFQYGFYGAFSLYTPERETEGYPHFIQESFSAQYQWKAGRDGLGGIMLNDHEMEEEDYLTFAIRDQAMQFIEDNRDNPFFLYVPFSAPHVPFQAPQEYYDRFDHIKDDNKRVYYSMISALDDAVGDIHDKLEAEGLLESTMIVFISDNGGATYTGATNNGPLKGGKLNQFEGGINVPFAMKWKGHIEPETLYPYPVSSLDIFTTAAQAASIPLPKDRVYDGVDLIPYLNNSIVGSPHDELYWRADHVWAMRKGIYKLIMSNRDGWVELYNLKTDKSEKYNRRDEYPEIVRSMIMQHQQWQLGLPNKPLWPKFMDYRFVIDGEEYLFPA